MGKFFSAIFAYILAAGTVAAGPIHIAARAGDLDEINRLISEGADVNQIDRIAGTPLHAAALKGRLAVAEALIAVGAKIDVAAGLSGGTALHMSALGGHSKVAALLLANGADVNARDARLNTPLHIAADNGDLATVELLIGAGADLKARNNADVSPIQSAGKAEHFDSVDLLIAHGVTPPRVAPVTGLLRDADPKNGHILFTANCSHCHTIAKGGPQIHGPNLWGLLERGKATAPMYTRYSGALSRLTGSWSYEDLNAWLAAPDEVVPGTLMTAFPGLKDPVDRADLIVYLRENGNAPPPLPK